MSTDLKTDQDVLSAIGAKDFRSITKKQIKEFAALFDDMDHDLAIRCIEQFPDFAKTSIEIIKCLDDTCTDAIKSAHIEDTQVIETYQSILDDLRFMLKKDDISDETRMYIMEKEVEIGDKVARLSIEHKEFLRSIFKDIGIGLLGLTGIGVFILTGGKVKLPKD